MTKPQNPLTPPTQTGAPEDEEVFHGASEYEVRNARTQGQASRAAMAAVGREIDARDAAAAAQEAKEAEAEGPKGIDRTLAKTGGQRSSALEAMVKRAKDRADKKVPAAPQDAQAAAETVAEGTVTTEAPAPEPVQEEAADLGTPAGNTGAATVVAAPDDAAVDSLGGSPAAPPEEAKTLGALAAAVARHQVDIDAARQGLASASGILSGSAPLPAAMTAAATVTSAPAQSASSPSPADAAAAQATIDSALDGIDPTIPPGMVKVEPLSAMTAYKAIMAIVADPSKSAADRIAAISTSQTGVEDSALQAYAEMCKAVLGSSATDEATRQTTAEGLGKSFGFLGASKDALGNEPQDRDADKTMELSAQARIDFQMGTPDADLQKAGVEAFAAGDFGKVAAHILEKQEAAKKAKAATAAAPADPTPVTAAPADPAKKEEKKPEEDKDIDYKNMAIAAGKGAIAIALTVGVPGVGIFVAAAFLYATKNYGKQEEKAPDQQPSEEEMKLAMAAAQFLDPMKQRFSSPKAAAATATASATASPPDLTAGVAMPLAPIGSPQYAGAPTAVGTAADKSLAASAGAQVRADAATLVTTKRAVQGVHSTLPEVRTVASSAPAPDPLAEAQVAAQAGATVTTGPEVVAAQTGQAIVEPAVQAGAAPLDATLTAGAAPEDEFASLSSAARTSVAPPAQPVSPVATDGVVVDEEQAKRNAAAALGLLDHEPAPGETHEVVDDAAVVGASHDGEVDDAVREAAQALAKGKGALEEAAEAHHASGVAIPEKGGGDRSAGD